MASCLNLINVNYVLCVVRNGEVESVGKLSESCVSKYCLTLYTVPILLRTILVAGRLNLINVNYVLCVVRNGEVESVGKLCESCVCKYCITLYAVPILLRTILVAGSLNLINVNYVVNVVRYYNTESVGNRSKSLIGPYTLTVFTYPVLYVTVLVAGRLNSFIVSYFVLDLGIFLDSTTTSTLALGVNAGCAAVIVAKCRLTYSTTNSTVLSLCTSCANDSVAFGFAAGLFTARTSRGLCTSSLHPVVAKSLAFGKAASQTSLGLSTGSTYPVVNELYTKSLSTVLTSLRLVAGSIGIIVSERLALSRAASTGLGRRAGCVVPFMLVSADSNLNLVLNIVESAYDRVLDIVKGSHNSVFNIVKGSHNSVFNIVERTCNSLRKHVTRSECKQKDH